MTRAIVVGAGGTGLSTAWALADTGCAVTVLEQGDIPFAWASSADQHRLIRHPYGGSVGFTRMVDDAYRVWEALWVELGARHYVETGTLVLGGPTDRWARRSAATLAELGLPHEPLDGATLSRDYPLLDPAGVDVAFRLDSGGLLLAERILRALADHLRARGVDLRARTPVMAVDAAHPSVTTADGATLAADLVVVAAGPWIGRLAPSLAGRVMPSRQTVVYVDPTPAAGGAWERMPMVLDIDGASGFYAVPPRAGTGMKVGDHRFSMTGDPGLDRQPSADEVAAIRAQCAGRIRDFARYPTAVARSCYYTVAAEERFQLAVDGRMVAVSACSGHGFKFAPLIGRRIADLALGRADPAEVGRWLAGEG